jgi:hypothetical protein
LERLPNRDHKWWLAEVERANLSLLASREANAPGTRLLISELFEADRELINALFDQTLDVIEDAFEARCTLW